MNALEQALAQSLTLSLPDKAVSSSGSVAVSRSGISYPAGIVHSETHIFDIPPELAALVRATHHNDVLIEEVHTLVRDPATPISPLALKILANHSTRTGVAIRYVVRDTAGNILFDIADARDAFPFYAVPDTVLASVAERVPGIAKAALNRSSDIALELQLWNYALAGCKRNFPTRDGASGYGAAVLTKTGGIYYGGQYSSFDQQTGGIHAEMGVLLNALMDGARDITHLGIASSKFPDTPCSPCGHCRQFVAEMARAYGFSPTFCLFASENERFASYTLEELLPAQWTSKK